MIRLPLFRDFGDDRPRTVWEWLVSPFVLLLNLLVITLFLLCLLVFGVITMLFGLLFGKRLQQEYEESLANWRDGLQQQGRLLSVAEADQRLSDGLGTIVVVNESAKGPTHVWWTEDDVVALAPAQFDPWSRSGKNSVLQAQDDALTKYAADCLEKHTNDKTGSALLIDWDWPEEQTLSQRFPNAQIVSIRAWGGPSIRLGTLY